LKESIKLINAKYHEKAIKGIQSGVLRDNPSMVRHGIPRIDVRKSWKEFHKMAVFNWFPYKLIPDFKPICGTCGLSDCMVKAGMNNPPRLVFGENENYLLNAPQQMCCTQCKKQAKLQQANMIPKEKRVQYNWLTTDDCILEQIACEAPASHFGRISLLPFIKNARVCSTSNSV
jgi:hypothetical protein